ncbi:MAG: amino acid ABC transporter permease [Mycobacterium sp.]
MTELVQALPMAVLLTLAVTATSFAIGAVLAVPLMLARVSKSAVLSTAARVVIESIRGVPAIVWLFIVYFGIRFGDLRFDPFTSAVLALGLIAAVYLAEIYRGGYLAVAEGQHEAAQAIGLSGRDQLVFVVAPQAARACLPSITSYGLGLLKDSSLASTIGVSEIVFVSTAAARVTTDGVLPFTVAVGIYLTLSVPLAILARSFDAWSRRKVAA